MIDLAEPGSAVLVKERGRGGPVLRLISGKLRLPEVEALLEDVL